MAIRDFIVGEWKTSTHEDIKTVEKGRTSYPSTTIGITALNRSGNFVMEDFLTRLQGRRGMQTYREMSMNDGVIGGVLNQINLRLRTAKWHVRAMDDSAQSQRLKRIVEKSLSGGSLPWNYTVSDMTSMLTFGWALFEQQYTSDEEGDIILGGLPFRGQTSLDSWNFNDKNEVLAFVQRPPNSSKSFTIPLKNCLHLTTTPSINNPEGTSILRTCYRSWVYKKTLEDIEGIGMERDMAGVPMLEFTDEAFDPLATANAKVIDYAEKIVTNVAKNQMQGLVIYPGMKFSLVQGHQPTSEIGRAIGRYNQAISISLASQFMTVAFEARGSGTVAEEYNDLMLDTFDMWLSIMVDMFKSQIVRRLKIYNGLDKAEVDVVPTKLAQRDLVDFAAFMSRLVRNGVIIPDDKLEDQIRYELNLPDLDKDSARKLSGVVENFLGEESPVPEKTNQDGGFVQVANSKAVPCDGDSIKNENSNEYVVVCKGIVVNTTHADTLEKAMDTAKVYQNLGRISLAKRIGKRKDKPVYRNIITI